MPDGGEESDRTIAPVHQSVAKLLGSQQTFEAPRYQRNYAWGSSEIAAFLSDLDTCVMRRMADGKGRHHFFGGLVTVKHRVPESNRDNLQVVDGQQRLATFAILVSRLRRQLREMADKLEGQAELADTLRNRADNLARTYEVYQDEIRLKNVEIPRVTLSVPDRKFFAGLLAGEPPASERKSHELLIAADEQIGKYLASLIGSCETVEEAARKLKAVHDVLKVDWTIIHMAANDRSDAYMLFQVLNDRGVTLTEGELLRSTTLEALEKASDLAAIERVEEIWNEMLGNQSIVVSNAFGWIYASQLGNWPTRGTMLEDYLAAFFPSLPRDGELDEMTAKKVVEEIERLSAQYHQVQQLIEGTWPISQSQGVSAWDRNRLRLLTRHLRYTDCISLLLAGCELPKDKFVQLVSLLERFAFRYAKMSEGPQDRARLILNRNAVEIRRDPENYRLTSLKEGLSGLVASYAGAEDFRSGIEQLRYSRGKFGNGLLKYLLATVEDYTAWFDEGGGGQVPVCRDKTRIIDIETGTIEHVYSQSADEPDPSLDPFLDTIGNLTLLSGPENDKIANKKFEEKRAILQSSASSMNRRIADETEWTVEVIEARAVRIADQAMRIFAI